MIIDLKNKLIPLFLLLSLFLFLPALGQSVSICYIANEGIAINSPSDDKQVLIDALFNGFYPQYEAPSDSILSLIYNNEPPFDGKRIVLFTHKHADHFNSELLANDLQNKNLLKVILPRQAGVLIPSAALNEKIATVDQKHEKFDFDDLTIECYIIEHINPRFKEVANVAYIVSIAGKKILHLGDAIVNSENLREIKDQRIDLVVLPYFTLDQNALNVINEKFSTPKIAPIHFDLKGKELIIQSIKSIPNTIVLSSALMPIEI